MEQDFNKVEAVYNLIAKEYADSFSDELEKKPKDREILKKFAQQIGDRGPVLDLGCGPGQTTRYLKNLGVDVSGLDLSEKMLEQAKKINPDIYFQKENILDLKFKNNSITGIAAFYAIVHFTNEQVKKAFREIFRILKPGGIFLFSFHIGEEPIHVDESFGKKVDIDFMFFTTDFILDCIKDIGFEIIEIIEREPYPEIEYQSRRNYIFTKKPDKNEK